MGNFNKFGVPWYASSDFPAIRSKTRLAVTPTEEQIQAVRNHQLLIKFIKQNFKAGDRVEFEDGKRATLIKVVPGDIITAQYDDGKITRKGTITIERVKIHLFKNARKI
jgi:hypothetical protein